jgi:aminopeptidase-like protein
LVAGYVVTCVGDPGAFTYMRSRRGDTLADRAAEHVLAQARVHYGTRDFLPNGSDERQYCSPGFDLPVGSLMRTPYRVYPQYHTSLDDLSLITPQALGESLRIYSGVIEALDANRVFRSKMPYGEPQLSRRGLYPTTGGGVHAERGVDDMMALLNFCDGLPDLLAVADRTRRPIGELRSVADLLCKHGLLEALPAEDVEQPLRGVVSVGAQPTEQVRRTRKDAIAGPAADPSR